MGNYGQDIKHQCTEIECNSKKNTKIFENTLTRRSYLEIKRNWNIQILS